jgi:hypothetical protein
MKTIILTLALGVLILVSCHNNNNNNNNKSFVIGSWTIDNLNTSDSSVNVETLFATSLVSNYTVKNILNFSSDNSLTISTTYGKELDKGNFKITDNETRLKIKFPNDKMESNYQITDKTDKTLKLSASDNGETVNILLTKTEK